MAQPRVNNRAASKPRKANRGSVVRNRQPSLRDVYLKSCVEAGIHPNSGVLKQLPDKAGAALGDEVLDVGRNYIGDKGIVPLMAVLDRALDVRGLIVSENGLRNKGVQALCASAARHPCLEYIDLSDNYVSEGAATSLEKLLLANHRIGEIVIENTKIDVEWRVKLRDLMESNRGRHGTEGPTTEIH